MNEVKLDGTVNQIAWAEQIKVQVNAEFDRIRQALESVGKKTTEQGRADVVIIIRILEEKRAEVMAHSQAGYFIHDWQDISDQVRQMIFHDARYQAIKSKRPARQPHSDRLQATGGG